ncbi:hypothetical protein, partial [Akkermansia sp.]|uniref:hypothetical protein n=1 Tax=Akkermansia sp. TaxID=1872421 RepID=UPI003AF4AA98
WNASVSASLVQAPGLPSIPAGRRGFPCLRIAARRYFSSFSLIGKLCINLSLNNWLYDWGRLSGGLAERRRVWLDMVHEV